MGGPGVAPGCLVIYDEACLLGHPPVLPVVVRDTTGSNYQLSHGKDSGCHGGEAWAYPLGFHVCDLSSADYYYSEVYAICQICF